MRGFRTNFVRSFAGGSVRRRASRNGMDTGVQPCCATLSHHATHDAHPQRVTRSARLFRLMLRCRNVVRFAEGRRGFPEKTKAKEVGRFALCGAGAGENGVRRLDITCRRSSGRTPFGSSSATPILSANVRCMTDQSVRTGNRERPRATRTEKVVAAPARSAARRPLALFIYKQSLTRLDVQITPTTAPNQ
jgi:hypothetical protein